MQAAEFDIYTADPATLLDETRYAIGKGELGDAAEAFQQYLVLMQGETLPPDAWLARGRIALMLERLKEARKFLAQAATSKDLKPLATYEIARAWMIQGRPEMAVEVLLPIASDTSVLIPYRCHAYSALGRCFAILGRARAAQNAMEAAGGFGVVSSQLLADDACRMLALGGVEEARRQLVTAAQSDASCIDAMVMLSGLLHAQERHDEAAQVAQYGLEQTPYALPLHSVMARILESVGQFSDAAGYWNHIVMISPRGESVQAARFGLARCLLRSGNRQGAIDALEASLDHAKGGLELLDVNRRIEALSNDAFDSIVEIADFPFTAQRRSWASPNPLASVLRFHNASDKSTGLTEQFSAGGLRWYGLASFLRGLPGMATRVFLSNIAQLRDLIGRGFPVIVGLGNGEGRWVTVFGVDDRIGTVRTQDPAHEGITEYSIHDFEQEWLETDCLAVVLTPEKDAKRVAGIEFAEEPVVELWMEALAERAEGRGDVASNTLKSLVKQVSGKGLIWRALLDIAKAEGRNSEIVAALDSAQAKSMAWCGRRWAMRARIEALYRMGRAREGLTFARKAVRLWPNEPGLRMLCGIVAMAAGHSTRGRAEVLRGLDHEPLSVWPRLELAKDYLMTGDLRWARHHLIAVMEVEPDNDEAASLLANMPDEPNKA